MCNFFLNALYLDFFGKRGERGGGGKGDSVCAKKNPNIFVLYNFILQEVEWLEAQENNEISHWTEPTEFANLIIFMIVKVFCLFEFLKIIIMIKK